MDKTHTEQRRVIYFRHYQCGFPNCSAPYEREVDFMEHNQFNHTEAQEFPCIYCGTKFPYVTQLTKHIAENVMYVCVICNKILPTYVQLKTHVSKSHTMQANSAVSIDSYIQLCIKCDKITENGQEMSKKISRFVYLPQSPVVAQASQSFTADGESQMQESFKCTKCSLVTNDEAYFEEHVVQCMKSQTMKPALLQRSKQLLQGPLPEGVLPKLGNRRKSQPEERQWDGNDCEYMDQPQTAQPQEHVPIEEEQIPEEHISESSQVGIEPESTSVIGENSGLQPNDGDNYNEDEDDDNEMPPLDPPPNSEKKKTVLQSLGKGSAVGCDKCSFQTDFRVVKAIHERVHLYGQDKLKFLWCPYCPYSTDLSLHFKIHIQGHQEKGRIRIYNCSYCLLSSNQMDFVEDHHEEAHTDLEFKLEVTRLVLEDLPCPQCPVSSKTEVAYIEHLEQEHGINEVQKYLKDMYAIAKLQIVDDVNPRVRQGQAEESSGSNSNEDVPMSTDIDDDMEDPEQGSQRFQCPHCTYSSNKCGTWIRHLQRHVGGDKQNVLLFCCKTCKWKSTSKSKVIEHCKSRHNEIFFEAQHVELSGGVDDAESPEPEDYSEPSQTNICCFHCDFCDFSTNEQSVFDEHSATHDEYVAPLPVNDVDEDSNNSQFDDIYTQEDNYTSDYSAASLMKDASKGTLELIDQMLATLSDDPRAGKQVVPCPICPFTSCVKRNVRRHLKVHQRQAKIKNGFKCAYCMYISELEGIVTKHIHRLHPDLPVKKIPFGNAKLKDEGQRASIIQNEEDVSKLGGTEVGRLLRGHNVSGSLEEDTLGLEVENVWSQNIDEGDSAGAPAFMISAVVGSDGSTGQMNVLNEDAASNSLKVSQTYSFLQ